MTVSSEHIESLRRTCGDSGVLNASDLTGHDPGAHPDNLCAGALVRPASTAEVSAVLAYCNTHGIGVVTQGGRTGLAMGAVSTVQEIVLDTSRLHGIESLDAVGGTAIVEAGVTLEALEQKANEVGLSVGIDLSARGTATIGGMVSTNAGGIEAFRNGITRQRVLGLEAILADGRVLNDLKEVSKANEGIDVRQLFIGAEGTLGVVTRIALSLVPHEPRRVTVLVSLDATGDAVRLFRQFRNASGGRLLSAELMRPAYARAAAKQLGRESTLDFEQNGGATFALYEVADDRGSGESFIEEIIGAAVERGEARNAVIAKNERQRDEMWQLREDSFAAEASYAHKLWFDVSVPLGNLDSYIATVESQTRSFDSTLAVLVIAHIGDGNVHTTVASMSSMEECEQAIRAIQYEPLAALNGSFSAEHGIGLEKREYLARYGCPTKLALMQSIKTALDPMGIMNPGKILPGV